MEAPDNLAVEATGLSVRYGERDVVRGVNLRVRQGEFVTIVGKSGCGKTTLLKALAGLVRYLGTIRRRGTIRMVFQEGLLLPWLTVDKNIRLGLTTHGASQGSEHVRPRMMSGQGDTVQTLLSEMGIEHLRNSYPYEISGGERQRVAIARAFAARPDVVLMDEPFGALDIFTRERMQTWLMDFWARHQVAVLFVTHDIEEGLLLGDRLTVMTDGELEPDHVIPYSRPRRAETKYTEKFLAVRRDIRNRIVGSDPRETDTV